MTNLHGLLLVDKPVGCTSHHVVAQVRRLLGIRAVGHAGTLDPIASGLLVLLIGEGTKISDYVLNGDKGYRARVKLGIRTDTQDRTGKVISERPVSVTREQLDDAINQLRGSLQLEVPSYSAVKVDGRKLYEYARKEQEVVLPVREMTFHQVDLLEVDGDEFEVELGCSKGSYVRAWVDSLGEILGCGACLQGLRRTVSHPYSVQDAITLDQLEQLLKETGDLSAITGTSFVSLAQTLPLFSEVRVTGRERELIENGQIASSLRGRLLKDLRHSSGRKILDEEGHKMLALVVSDEVCNLRIRRVFHY